MKYLQIVEVAAVTTSYIIIIMEKDRKTGLNSTIPRVYESGLSTPSREDSLNRVRKSLSIADSEINDNDDEEAPANSSNTPEKRSHNFLINSSTYIIN